MTELHGLSEMNKKETEKVNKNLLKYKIWVDPESHKTGMKYFSLKIDPWMTKLRQKLKKFA